MLNIPFALCEAVSDLTAFFMTKPQLPADSREVVRLCVDWASEFETRHPADDWIDGDYLEAIGDFFEQKYRAWIESIPAREMRFND